ncbi:Outer membrane protein IML2 mitochondrial/Tetratricopeptide repeat protein 39 [Penicillium angulare]|uniref:Outer membrane protein IML2 mitochondrial/Tetratricopeptide repeat protein 39 n=1 Tax=Penicillium angulare TaxID=116970 RepID=UPI0025416227|nr:Outer membrane protein IML2 mitochondrial/Tetratricopeptide repeat protein 39 [Penicillium angulare]KAJ5279866.1 Outer membrane protein IML2 mitochondrial/Tetratricopeptide repeat protein 39 [Penicillium angulare]
MVAFVRATLGFEQEIMKQACERLYEAETSAGNDQYRAQQNAQAPNAFHSEIYTAGTEYALCQAIAQLMGAVVGVLNESLTESIKAFYRLRKAYITLDAILKMEEKFMESRGMQQALSSRSSDLSKASANPAEPSSKTFSSKGSSATANTATPLDTDLAKGVSGLNISPEAPSEPVSRTSTPSNITHDPDSDIFKNEIDIFIHSGANFCFGILLVLISMVPPAFSKLLSIIGFHGDKQRGLKMLWQASKFHNLVGAMAALAMLGYYNGFVRYCDIMPDPTPGEDDVEGYQAERLAALLAEMRSRFPNSRLWLLEESRMKGANKDLDGALELLSANKKSPLKQVEALCVFEKSLNALFLHRYTVCSDAFIECVDLNSWSRALYYYIAGSCHVALYRQFLTEDPKKAQEHADTATEYIRNAPPLAGKKRFMARQLPFDVFVTRKIAKWEARAKEWNVSLVDAIGVDPIEEMIFFWNGHSRMTEGQLHESLDRLSWCESEADKTWSREGPEEKAIMDLLRAAVYRSLRRHEEAKQILKTKVLNNEKSIFKGHLKDDWVLPAANFEMAANLWMERPAYNALHGSSDIVSAAPNAEGKSDSMSENAERPDTKSVNSVASGGSEAEKKLVRACKEHLDHAAKWESYELDARIGLKVTAGNEAIRKWESMHST